jgi:uncharacterized protein (UPF0332 family)
MASIDRAEVAANAFTRRLLAGPLRASLRKVVLFGSSVKGAASDHSDVDVLVVLSKPDGGDVAQAAFETQCAERVGLEPIVVALEDLFPVTSYFLYTALRTGKEIYSVSPDLLKREERSNLLALAEEYLDGADQARGARQWRLAVDAAYNAAELAIKSLVLGLDDDLPGSHGGLVGRFGELYVKPGPVDKGLGRRANQALERRNHARYRFQATIDSESAAEVTALARELMDLARARLAEPT